ncbi:FKBP-type peptidyl-prolyl cis-trans isomerase [Chloropicon primus]|uniref:peptidylprolyl isomerase n=1 Tax=Chloropicon primus TaxID=1764295 RepID=A0A5B8MN31_9CHLO|nr:FKBP-type peptidyl-prolyl cis-trans isomerase [Chloropicon primus]UPR00665.1 FKBP-type peptidyl-prolyl cis-trans isomerase [Chloropicon primus]|eukprot:QDZ21454.1 FKBP-type peptidyl-prolyl cis-trans isomerase [Chloropicon primus]
MGDNNMYFEDLGEDSSDMDLADLEEFNVGEEKNVTNDGGVKKKVLKKGQGYKRPEKGDKVFVHYVGTLLDGTKFDSSRDKGDPFTFELKAGRVIKGWDEGVATMTKGELCVLTCEPQYAYGDRGFPPTIPANATLQFEVELLSWESTKDITGDGGIIKTVVEEGKSWEQPKDKDEVTVEYKIFHNKEEVASSPQGGIEFVAGDEANSDCVIPAFSKCVTTMKKGEVAKLSIQSPEYGFGEAGLAGKVPPGAKIKAELTLVSWKSVKMVEETIEMKLLVEQEGYQKPNEGSSVKVDLVGKLEDGTVVEEKAGFEFVTDDEQVIRGLDKVVMEMKKDEKVLAKIPPEHAYGSSGGLDGKVPADATLVYEVTLKEFVNAKESFEMDAKEMMEAALKFKDKGNSYFKKGDYEVAIQKYEKAVKYLEHDSKYTEDEKSAAKKVKIACWNNEAQCGLKRKDYAGAKKRCDKVLKVDSQNIKGLYRRAQSYIGTKDYLEASTDLKNALLIDPGCREAKLEMKRLLKLQADKNKKDKKLYANMFSKISFSDHKAEPAKETEEEGEGGCQKGCCGGQEEGERAEEENAGDACQAECCSHP